MRIGTSGTRHRLALSRYGGGMNCQLPVHRFKIRPLVNAKGFNTRLVLDGLRAALLRAGITVEGAQSAEDGQDTELAILMTLTPRLPGGTRRDGSTVSAPMRRAPGLSSCHCFNGAQRR